MTIAGLMRQVKKIRPWMVAVALACGGGAAVHVSCGGDDGSCEPRTFYGPATCTTDEECVARQGPGAYCDPDPLVFDDGCGNQVTWGRICRGGGAADGDADADDADVSPSDETTPPADVVEDIPVYYGPPPTDGGTDFDDVTTYYGPPPADVVEDIPSWYGPPPEDASTDSGTNLYGPPPADVYDGPSTLYGPTPVDGGDGLPPAYYGPPTA